MTHALSKEKILTAINTAYHPLIEDILILDEIHSTNDYVKNLNCAQHKIVACLAEKQTAGKGQRGKTWVSPHKNNIYLSVLCYDLPIESLSLKVGFIVVRALKKLGLPKLYVKYPNDIFYESQKLGGILIEIIKNKIIIGIGLNINMEEEAIDQPWTSIKKITHQESDRNTIVGLLMNELVKSFYDRS